MIVSPPIRSKLSFAYGVPLIPFIKIKYVIAVSAKPPNTALIQVALFSKSYDKSNLDIHCTIAPMEKATMTDSRIPNIILVAVDVFI